MLFTGHDTKAYRGMQEYFHPSLIWALDWNKWSDSCPGRFPCGESHR